MIWSPRVAAHELLIVAVDQRFSVAASTNGEYKNMVHRSHLAWAAAAAGGPAGRDPVRWGR